MTERRISAIYKVLVHDPDSNTWRVDNWSKLQHVADGMFRELVMAYPGRGVKMSRYATDDRDIEREMDVIKFVRGK